MQAPIPPMTPQEIGEWGRKIIESKDNLGDWTFPGFSMPLWLGCAQGAQNVCDQLLSRKPK